MTTLFPGATWVPIPGQENRARRRKGRGVGYHVAVYEGPSLAKIDQGTGNDSHLYVRFDGSVEQNVDLDLISYAMVDGNATLITVETEGGARPATVETEPWTPQQVATLARILRWAHDTEGAPLQLMPDSKPASRGACYHRQGVDPWRVPGGEKWSTVYGKTCPGAAKIAQLPQIIALANGDDDMPLSADDLSKIQAAVWGYKIDKGVSGISGAPQPATLVLGDVFSHVRGTSALVAKLAAQDPSTVTAADIAAAIPADIAQQVVDALVSRLKTA